MTTVIETYPVSPADKNGLALLAQMHRRAFAAQREKPWTIEAFASLLSSPGVDAQIYSVGSEPVGFLVVRSVLDEAELITIAVDPDRQGRGYAGSILTDSLKRLSSKGVVQIYLEVRQDNLSAIALYRSAGFKKTGARKAYYQTIDGKKIDADVFSLSLG